MNKKVTFTFILIIILIVNIGLFFYYRKPQTLSQAPVSTGTMLVINNKKISLEVADTEAKQEQGLSDRESLAQNAGMLFVFPVSGQWAFWMKDMNFPLDMIWLDRNYKVVYIKEHADPARFPEGYTNTTPALYVLEVNDGFVAENNVKINDILNVSYK